MWFATRFGIGMYDGSDWVTYNMSDGLPTAAQERVFCSDDGRVWSIGWTYLAAVFENGSWKALPTFEVPRVEFPPPIRATVAAGRDGTILFVGPREGDLRYYKGESWHTILLPDGSGRIVHDIISTENRVILATDSGVWLLDPNDLEGGVVRHPLIPHRRAMSVCTDELDEALWIVDTDYIGRVRDGRFEIVRDDFTFQLVRKYRYLITETDRFGGLYIGNPTMLYRYDDTGFELLGSLSGLSGDGATSVFLDREGDVWVGALRGATKFTGMQFANYSIEHGLQDDEVTAIIERQRGGFVLGHPAGLTLMGDDLRTISLPRRTETRVLDLAEDPSGDIWAAVNDLGLARINERGEIEWFKTDDGFDIHTTSVLVDRSGKVWAMTQNNLFVEENGQFRRWERNAELKYPRRYLRRLFEARDGTIHIASMAGLYILHPDETRLLVAEPGRVAANNVYSFLEDSVGTKWVGARAGLYTAKTDTLLKVHEPGPRIDRPVYFITAEENGRLWFGTDNGVMRWDGEVLEHITSDNGLIGGETNRAAGLADSRGRVWIGMDRGLSVYRSRFDVIPQIAPIVELVGVDVNGKELPLDRSLSLGPGSKTLVFRFRAMSFIDEKKVKIRCWLEGFEDTWLEPFDAPNREIRYTNLSPGNYKFHLRAAGATGIWSEPVTSAPIVIDAPYWRKPPFYLAVITLAGLLVFGAIVLVSQRRYAMRLQSEVRARVEELRGVETELERARRIETLGVLAGGIAHDFNNLLTVIISNLSLRGRAKDAHKENAESARDALAAANRARALTQQLLTFSSGGAPLRRPGSIAEVITESASFVTSGSGARCDVELPEDLWVADIDSGQISQVLNNLLLNANQSMRDGGVIVVRGKNHVASPHPGLHDGPYIEIMIGDTGEGIAPDHMDRVFDPYFTTKDGGSGLGLTTAYSIVKRHEGLLTLDSETGVGTTCRIYLPASATSGIGSKPQPIDRPKVEWGPVRVLVMDDEPAIRRAVTKVLTQFGYTVETTGDGDSAASLYKKRLGEGDRFDLVIMDLTVSGGMGGKTTLKRLLQIDPRVTAIVASGYSSDPVVADYASYGFRGSITKPYSADELLHVVAETLARDR
jgi:signal transduction histidine kinase/ligand-binding sensor domain-containing protein/ActR/RegA family two-component response regulator